MTPFHLAFPVDSIQETKTFYVDILNCSVGRSAERWIDFNFFGHQLSAHLVDDITEDIAHNDVDHDKIPVRHFGVILEWTQWHQLHQKLSSLNHAFFLEPKIRFKGEVGEQGTFFIKDPSGNCLEFKTFKDPNRIFAS